MTEWADKVADQIVPSRTGVDRAAFAATLRKARPDASEDKP